MSTERPVADDPAEQRCDMSVRTSALPGDRPPTTEHVGDDVYLDRNEYGEVVGVEVLDARAVTINGVEVSPFPGEFRALADPSQPAVVVPLFATAAQRPRDPMDCTYRTLGEVFADLLYCANNGEDIRRRLDQFAELTANDPVPRSIADDDNWQDNDD